MAKKKKIRIEKAKTFRRMKKPIKPENLIETKCIDTHRFITLGSLVKHIQRLGLDMDELILDDTIRYKRSRVTKMEFALELAEYHVKSKEYEEWAALHTNELNDLDLKTKKNKANKERKRLERLSLKRDRLLREAKEIYDEITPPSKW